MKEKHIEESARAPEKSGHLNGELILMIFQELSTPFLFFLKKSEKLKTLSVYYNHLFCLPNPTFWEFPKQKTDLFPFFEKRDIARSKF